MNCNTVQNLLSAYIDNELSADQRRELRKHLFACSCCNEEYETLNQLKNCLSNVTQAPVSFDCFATLQTRLSLEKKHLTPQAAKIFWSIKMTVVAASFMLFLLSTLVLFPTNDAKTKIAQNSNMFSATDGLDQNIAIDQPVTIYQASLIIP